jgi:ABC-type Na+ transport system ATPase subunit NatA
METHSMNSTILLKVNAVEKKFASVKAVNHLSFEVSQGEVFALLGPNGAGKTTMIRMILGIIRPDSGDIHFQWPDSKKTLASRGQVGYLPEERGLYKEIPILRTLTYLGTLRGMRRKAAAAAAQRWIERFGLKERATDKLETLSKGNQQKVQFIAAILHQPSLVILDEPFSGLDPINQELFSTIIRELRRNGWVCYRSLLQPCSRSGLFERRLRPGPGCHCIAGRINLGAASDCGKDLPARDAYVWQGARLGGNRTLAAGGVNVSSAWAKITSRIRVFIKPG